MQLPAVRLEKPKAYVPPSLRFRSATAEHAANVASGRPGRDLNSAAHLTITDPAAAAAAAAASRGPNGTFDRCPQTSNDYTTVYSK